MTPTIDIQLPPETLALAAKFRKMPSGFPQAIKRGMTRALEVVAGRIRDQRLSGKGPFPVTEHRLGEVTSFLKSTTRSEDAIVVSEGDSATVIGKIRTDAPYAWVHEFGWSGEVKPRPRRGKSRNVRQRQLTFVKAHTRTIPARAPFHVGVSENVDYIVGEIENELASTLA